MPATMRAIRMHEFGAPDVLRYEEAPRPEPEAGELLVRVQAAGVNPVDWKTRERGGFLFPLERMPAIPGWDVSGTVEEVGEAVEGWAPGDEVFSLVRFPGIGAAYAEYTTVPVEHAARKPVSLSHVEAAAIPLVTLTAWQALFEAGDLQAGQRVLIHAAAGGVGHMAVQLAKWRGAHVTGTASGRNEAFVRGLGADECVDYTTTRFEDVVRGIDLVLDSLGGETRARSWGVLKPGGLLITIVGNVAPEEAEPHGVSATRVLVRSHGEQLGEIAELIDAGHLRPHIDAVLPLREAARAHEQGAANRTRGKIVLQVVE